MHVIERKLGEETVESPVESPVEPVTGPASETYGLQVKHEINNERAKAGLPEIPSEDTPTPEPPKENFLIGGVSLLVILFLLLSNS